MIAAGSSAVAVLPGRWWCIEPPGREGWTWAGIDRTGEQYSRVSRRVAG